MITKVIVYVITIEHNIIKKNSCYLFDIFQDAPIQSKKSKFQETQKLKKMITKTVNNVENELREIALEGRKTLTKKDASNSQKK